MPSQRSGQSAGQSPDLGTGAPGTAGADKEPRVSLPALFRAPPHRGQRERQAQPGLTAGLEVLGTPRENPFPGLLGGLPGPGEEVTAWGLVPTTELHLLPSCTLLLPSPYLHPLHLLLPTCIPFTSSSSPAPPSPPPPHLHHLHLLLPTCTPFTSPPAPPSPSPPYLHPSSPPPHLHPPTPPPPHLHRLLLLLPTCTAFTSSSSPALPSPSPPPPHLHPLFTSSPTHTPALSLSL